MPPRSLDYVRCPCCGKLSRGQNYGQAGTAQGHLLEVATQYFIGGGTQGRRGSGFRWVRRPVNVSDLPFLRTLLTILDRVRAKLAATIEALSRPTDVRVNAYAALPAVGRYEELRHQGQELRHQDEALPLWPVCELEES